MGPLAPERFLSVIITLTVDNETDLLHEARFLAGMAPASEWQKVREAAALVDSLLHRFDYFASPEFEKKASGKPPDALATMKRMESEPVRLGKSQERFKRALATIVENDEAFSLVPESMHGDLERLRQLIKGLPLAG